MFCIPSNNSFFDCHIDHLKIIQLFINQEHFKKVYYKTKTIYISWKHFPRITKILLNDVKCNITTYEKSKIYMFNKYNVYTSNHILSRYKVNRIETEFNKRNYISKYIYLNYNGTVLSLMLRDKTITNVNPFIYKTTKYYDEITEKTNDPKYIKRWLKSKNNRIDMQYKTIKLISSSNVDPNFVYNNNIIRYQSNNIARDQDNNIARGQDNNNEFPKRIKDMIKSKWNYKRIVKFRYRCDNGLIIKKEISTYKDIVGIYCINTKAILDELYSKDKNISDIVLNFHVEHIMSNCYGTDNNDVSNGTILNSKINIAKGSTMFFLISDDIIEQIELIKSKQKLYLSNHISLLRIFDRSNKNDKSNNNNNNNDNNRHKLSENINLVKIAKPVKLKTSNRVNNK